MKRVPRALAVTILASAFLALNFCLPAVADSTLPEKDPRDAQIRQLKAQVGLQAQQIAVLRMQIGHLKAERRKAPASQPASMPAKKDLAAPQKKVDAPTKSGRLIPGGDKMQAQRKELIQNLIHEGVFTKVARPGSRLRVYTGRVWNGLTIDQKRDFVSVVYAYEFAGKRVNMLTDAIFVYDGFTGKKIGDMGGDGRLQL